MNLAALVCVLPLLAVEENEENVAWALRGDGCGKPGMGEVAKLTNNLILGISMVASAEGMAIGEKLGIDPKTLQ